MFERLIPNASATYLNNQVQQNDIASSLGFEPDLTSKIGRVGNHSVCLLNKLGYMPVISTFTGAYRALVGLAYLVVSAVRCIFDGIHRHHHLESMKIGAANFGRGLIEMVPVAGNLVAANIDVSRMMHRWADSNDYSYGDEVPIFNSIEMAGAIPLIGIAINIPMFLFYFAHTVVNIPLAITGDNQSVEAAQFALERMGRASIACLPIAGFAIIGFIQMSEQPHGVYE